MKRGHFFAIYGINNIGKSTHAKRLVERLNKLGKKAFYIKFPVYDLAPTGPYLNKVLRAKKQTLSEPELQLWFVLNRYQFEPKLLALLQKGVTVVAEDYIGTGIAWGLTKGAKQHELEMMNKFLVQEDVSILLQGKRHQSSKEKKHIHEQNERLMQRAERIFRKLGKQYQWKTVERAQDPDVTAARLWAIIKAL